MRFPQFSKNNSATSVVQPIIIHAVLDVSGHVIEAEPLQTTDAVLSDAALNLVKNTNYGPVRNRERIQRNVFINVQFVPAQ